MFSFEIVLTARNKLNDFRVSRDSYVKYKFIFNRRCPRRRRRRRRFLNSILSALFSRQNNIWEGERNGTAFLV